MKDSFGREIDYLRISLTDRCDLRCIYCMPACGVKNIPHSEILTLEEVARIAKVMSSMGVKKIRLTGGEPLIRKNITGLVRMIRDTGTIEEIALTTNGTQLAEYALPLKEAGLDRINISLDTLDSGVFRKITGKDCLNDVLKGIDCAFEAGFPIKLNCVPLLGLNDNELDRIALFAKERPIDVRFIELMPIGCGREHRGLTSDEVKTMLESRFGEAQSTEDNDSSSPAVYLRFSGFCGRIGFISPLTHKFCKSCNRARLTADGFLKLCLQYPDGVDLKSCIRSGSSDEELKKLITDAIMKKPLAHSFSEASGGDDRKMVQIGG